MYVSAFFSVITSQVSAQSKGTIFKTIYGIQAPFVNLLVLVLDYMRF